MATFAAGTMGLGASDGVAFDSPKIRKGLTAFDVVHGSSPLAIRGGKIPAGGTPLKVNSLGTSQVQVKAGQAIITPNAAGTAPYPFTLEADSNLDVAAAHASLVRIDLVIISVQDVGTSSSLCQVEILQGTAGSGRPNLPTTPSTTHAMSIATITLPAGGGATIQSAWITQEQSDTWAKTGAAGTGSDATWTCAPGGTVMIDFASPSSLFQMSATRRQGFAALFAPGTRWVDTVNRLEGYFDGTDIVPTTIRAIYNGYDAGDSAAVTGAFVDLLVPPGFTLLGGSRIITVRANLLIRATAITSGPLGPVATVTGMQGPGMKGGVIATTGIGSRIAIEKTWTLVASGTISSGTWKLQCGLELGTGTLRCEQMSLAIIDEGPD